MSFHDLAELDDCHWFSRAEVLAMLEGRHQQGLFTPGLIAITRTLPEHWQGEGRR